jgi:hypothetical protein
MTSLGHERFAVVDRGSYVAMRTALDHPLSFLSR